MPGKSHDQKRKAKLAKRAKKQHAHEVEPYTGRKYQADEWVPHVSATELAIYETIILSQRRLSNLHVKKALERLVLEFRVGNPALLPPDTPAETFAEGREVEYLMWNIRRNWAKLIADVGPVASQDLVGILRTLLNSIKAHAWSTGPSRGYVEFLVGFMSRIGEAQPGTLRRSAWLDDKDELDDDEP